MSQSIWTRCAGKSRIKSLQLTAWRVVENQYQVSTRRLVDSADEQRLLEDLIEEVKPPRPTGGAWDHFHFLLWTPFRYPPLRHGSRFGSRQERGIWYGAVEIPTALAEVAFLRFRLLNDTEADIQSEVKLTAFNIPLKSLKAVDLTKPPFDRYENKISNKTSYADSQLLGKEMREAGVEFLKYTSARDDKGGANVAVFSPKAFARKDVNNSDFQTWHGFLTKTQIDLSLQSFVGRQSTTFKRTQFEVNGTLPSMEDAQ